MTVYFGENLRRLRKERELTQEALASFLSVSFQSVSKWERGEAYPDITTLPAIASFFGVTTDEMLGINKINNSEKINGYIDFYDKMKLKDRPLTLEKFKTAVKEFPGEFSLLIRYMELLSDEKDFANLPDYNNTTREIMSIYENIQKHCTDDKIRIRSKKLLCYHLVKKYDLTCSEEGKYGYNPQYLQQAESIISEMPSIDDSEEWLSLMLCDKNNWHDKHRSVIEKFSRFLQELIISYCYYDDSFTPEFKIQAIKSINGIFDIIDTDKSDNTNRIHLIYNHGHLGHLYFETGDTENSLKHLKICAEKAKKLDEEKSIFERIALYYETAKIFHNMDMCTRMTLLMKKHYPLSEEFKASDGFKEIISLMGNKNVKDIELN